MTASLIEDPARNSEFRKLWRSGLTKPQVARAMGVHESTIGKWRAKLGLPARDGKVLLEDPTVGAGLRLKLSDLERLEAVAADVGLPRTVAARRLMEAALADPQFLTKVLKK